MMTPRKSYKHGGPKRQGTYYESLFKTACLKRGLDVSSPEGDHLDYDVVIGGKKDLRKIQVKGTAVPFGSSGFRVTMGHGRGKEIYDSDSFDFLAVYVDIPDVRTWYVIPRDVLGRRKTVRVFPQNPASRGKYERYKNAFHIL